ncbi:adenylate/guanylate cyclase domain-containing protein, partial [bacterium]|nr:adenylate/guanylate cyclase domain-containing protein [bacterium]
AGIAGFATINIYLFVLERKEKSYIKNAFGQYLSPKVIEDLVNDPSKLSLGGERREMTAFFSDVQGFSTISESLTPDELVQLLNDYLTEMCAIIAKHDGTIDKFEGDAIIAFWGAPLDQPDHATRACLACIDMQKRLVELRKRWASEGRPQLLVRMGVNSGPMVVGNMGSQTRMDYTIMGDAVNLAARLEGANKFYKNFTMISEFTYKQAVEFIDCRELDTIRVVGKNEPITVYEVLDRKNMVTGKMAEMVEIYNKGLELYKKLRFKEAITSFESALALFPMDGPSKTYISRCKGYLENPPEEGWDGVFTHTEKG